MSMFIVFRSCLALAEKVSASCELASCSGRRSGGHLHHLCVPRVVSCRRLRMTERIGLLHRDSQGIDTSRISEFRWAVRRLPPEILRLNWLRMSTMHMPDAPWAVTSYRRHRQPPGLSSIVFSIQSVDIRSRELLPVAPL